ncbi:MAG: hypothetical protein ACLVAW_15700 [Eisenbergiella massiliensis]
MKKKLLSIFLTCCMVGGMLNGCGSSQSESGNASVPQESSSAQTQTASDSSETKAVENITIEFFNQKQEEAAQQAYRNAAEEFHKEYPNTQ